MDIYFNSPFYSSRIGQNTGEIIDYLANFPTIDYLYFLQRK